MTTDRIAESVAELRDAAEALLLRYTKLIESGDCGNWDPWDEDEVIHLASVLEDFPKERTDDDE